MTRMNDAQLTAEIRKRVNAMIRDERANLDPNKLASLNINQISTDIASQWKFEEWDKISPINGVSASRVIEKYNIEEDDSVFMLLQNDRVVFFQPFEPGVQGKSKMTPANVRTIAQDMLDKVIDAVIIQTIIPLLEV
jgi:hypothetical protein